MSDLLLGIDLGTGGVRALLVDGSGRVVAAHSAEHPLSTPRPGWAEQEPESWWTATVAAVRGALGKAPGCTVAAIGLSGQMHGLVMCDAKGAPLRPCILWCDNRSAPQCEEAEARIGLDRLLELAGNRMLPGFTAPKILWCRRHEPDLERRAAIHLLPKDWLRHRLSGTFATEVSDASGTLLFDCANRRFSEELCGLLEIDPTTLPPCFESPELSSRLSRDAAARLGLPEGIPIAGGGGDQAAQAVGTGIVREGPVSLTLGTSGCAFAARASWPGNPGGILHAFCHAVPGTWHLMSVMLSAGGSLRWFRDEVARDVKAAAAERGVDPYDLISEEAMQAAPGAEGLLFLPYLSGERTPVADPHARGAFVGLSIAHTRSHLARAVFEGITFGARDGLDLIREAGTPIDSVRLSGGGARSPMWRRLCADVFGVPATLVNTSEGAAYGAALIAGAGCGMFASVESAADAAVRETERIDPGPDASAYSAILARYRALYPALRGFFPRDLD
ncbi:MAG: xylulokinase [Phycisphaerales bacterium]